jgi:hypothetical protein
MSIKLTAPKPTMSKMPPHVISVMVYCHRCKQPHTVLHPETKIAWRVYQTVEGENASGQLFMDVRCPSCQKDIEISLKKWKQILTD